MADDTRGGQGRQEKARKFTPRKGTTKGNAAGTSAHGQQSSAADASTPPVPAAQAPDAEAASGPASTSDPFAQLIEQAKAAQIDPAKGHKRRKQEQLSVAFSGSGVPDDAGPSSSAKPRSTKSAAAEPATKASARAGTRHNKSSPPGTDAAAALPSKGGRSGSKKGGRLLAKASKGAAAAMEVDDSLLDDVDAKSDVKQEADGTSSDDEAPFLHEDAYYPTLLPFQRVDELHDSEALSRHVIPTDLAEREEPPEGNTAEELGLTSATPNHTVWLLQLPPLLPAVPLVEAGERKAAANTTPADASAAPVATPVLPELSGPEVLRALPSGKIGVMQMTRKGRLKIKMGCCSMDVMPGAQPQCRSELYAINLATKDMVMLAENSKHAVAALDLASIVRGDKGT